MKLILNKILHLYDIPFGRFEVRSIATVLRKNFAHKSSEIAQKFVHKTPFHPPFY